MGMELMGIVWQERCTVKPLLKVVLSVVLPWLTGVARLRVREGLERPPPCLMPVMARWARRPWCRLCASRRVAAMVCVCVCLDERTEEMEEGREVRACWVSASGDDVVGQI